MSSQEQGAHWSKDFIEHLRTIHFALIAVSVGLIALSLAHPALERALKQLKEIEKISDLGEENSFRWIDGWSEIQVKRALSSGKITPRTPTEDLIRARGEVLSSEYYCNTKDGLLLYSLSQEWTLIPDPELYGEVVDTAFLRTQVPSEGAVIETSSLSLQKDMRLDDFKKIWNFFHHHLDIVVPLSIDSRLFVWDSKQLQWDEYKCGDHKGPATRFQDDLQIGLLSDSTLVQINSTLLSEAE